MDRELIKRLVGRMTGLVAMAFLCGCAPLVVSVCPNYLPSGAMIRDDGMFYDGMNTRNITRQQSEYYSKRWHIKIIERVQSANKDKDGFLPHRTIATSRIAKEGYKYINTMLSDSFPEMRVDAYEIDGKRVETSKDLKRLMRLRRDAVDSVGVDTKKRIVSITTKK